MRRLEDALARAARDVEALHRRWCLIGGLAVSARTEPRFTRDIDLAVAVLDDGDAERLVADLKAKGYGISALIEQADTKRLATIRLITPGEDEAGVVIDLLFASSGVEAEIVQGAEPIELFPGIRVPVARAGHLIALKVLSRHDSRRPQDAADLRALLSRRTDADLKDARTMLDLIQMRGYGRGRELASELSRALRDFGD